MTKMAKRMGCGAADCVHNLNFRCIKESIEIDETTHCLDYKAVPK